MGLNLLCSPALAVRYDGEALPIHAACALRPPSSFIETLAKLYPVSLAEKDKKFGRVPLHVACRCTFCQLFISNMTDLY